MLGIDKLTVIAAHLSIKPILIINKTEINPVKASELFDIYSFSGINTFLFQENTHDEVKAALLPLIEGNVCTFAGESGVGKSTLLNSLFGEDISKTSVLSDKSKRGRQTTRESVLYPISFCKSPSFLADTPGFSLLDFEKNSFVDKYELAQCFSDFISFTDKCKYNKCSHTVEEGCAVLEAVREGKIKKTRHESYMYLYNCVKNFKPWEKRS
ncbi:Small ribosomal subunit biogenesis GTPase RsgA [bioreactor metagenome]|uniref:Small ribosomal subunit biogenesis GTPase RsgA n=1 Tax=bioreactor metagenome TaxID=1076179 RepID=A0A645GFZ9_9ZZZZ